MKNKLLEMFNKVNNTNIDFMISHMDDISNDIINEGNGIKKFKNCTNNNLISESSLNRLLDLHSRGEWAIITAYRSNYSKEENIKRNRILRGVLNNNRMGVHQLVGHWRECTLQGVDYNSCPKDKLVDSVERSYFVPKPDGYDSDEFKKLMLDLMIIDGETQDAIIYFNGDKIQILGSNGDIYDELNDLSLNKIGQAYSQHIKKLNVPFIFEGAEIPGSNSGKMVMNYENIKFLI